MDETCRSSVGTPTGLSRAPSGGETGADDEATRKRKKEPTEAVVDETRFKVRVFYVSFSKFLKRKGMVFGGDGRLESEG
jgi:hypothetical protein